MRKLILGISCFSLIAGSCSRKEKVKTERVYDVNVTMEKSDYINIESTRKQYHAHDGEYYSGVDTTQIYGAGYVRKIEDSLRGYDLDIYISAWLREVDEPNEGGIALSLNTQSGVKDWLVFKCKKEDFKKGEWVQVKDTVRYSADRLKDVSEIKIFSMKEKGSDLLDVDDLRIRYKFHK